jgi:alkane 1-monooxygenase
MFAHALPFAISLTFLPMAALGLAHGGWWAAAGLLYAFLIIPLVDQLMGLTKANLDPATEESRLVFHRFITWMWVPIQIALIFTVIAVLGASSHLSTFEIVLLTMSVGIVTGGIGITYAHELIHQTNRFERSLGEILMTSTLYGHFCIEHVHGHHIHVGTPKDPVSARQGESVWRFLPRAVFGSLISAWGIQRDRMTRRGKRVWHLSNPFWRYSLAYTVYFAAAYILAGWLGVGVFALQAVVAFLLLEVINYVEHYGLTRRLLPNGRYERVQPHHSWNASHEFTNYFLINLQRHSDHHKHPQRRYPVLQHYDEEEAPQLPFGYPTMLIMALVPPVWFRVMDPKVEAWKQRHQAVAVAPEAGTVAGRIGASA